MRQDTEKELSDRVAERFKHEGIPFAREMAIGGVRVDFALWNPKKKLIVVELKGWEPSRENIERARNQVELYKQRTGAAEAYVLFPGLKRGEPARGVVNESELISAFKERLPVPGSKGAWRGGELHVAPRASVWVVKSGTPSRNITTHHSKEEAVQAARFIAQSSRADVVVHGREGRITSRDSYGTDVTPPKDVSGKKRMRPAVARNVARKAAAAKKERVPLKRVAPRRGPKKIFAAMPFAGEYDDVYFVAMAPAADKVGAVCDRVDHQTYSGDVVEQIKKMIRASSAVIVDFSGSRPNVLYEAGYAEALGIPTIHICSTPLDNLPFDVRNHRTIPYNKGQTHKLSGILTRELVGILP